MTPDDINPQYDLREANKVRQREWDKGNVLPLLFRTNELYGETGEAANVVKKLERERLGIDGSRDTIDHLLEELADVVICLDLVGLHLNVPAGFEDEFASIADIHKLGGMTVLQVTNLLAHKVGDICGHAFTSDIHKVDVNPILMSNLLREATWCARRLGAFHWRSVDEAVEAKFNATSEKLNLKTRFIRK